jgi:hypothetical protein
VAFREALAAAVASLTYRRETGRAGGRGEGGLPAGRMEAGPLPGGGELRPPRPFDLTEHRFEDL